MAAATAATLAKTGGLLLRHVIPSSIRSRPPHYSSVIPQSIYSKTLKSGTRKSLYCTISSNNNAIIEEPHSSSSNANANSKSNSNGNEEEGAVVSEEDKRKELGNMLDIRVGKIVKIWRHEEADTLYVEEVDVGEAEPRVICSGLVKYINIDHLLDKKVVVLANLKPRNMRGVKSSGMLMAASDASHENVELLVPPEGSLPGERVWFGSEDEKESLPDAASPNQIQKKKIWESVQPHLKTDASCAAKLGEHYMRTSTGVIVSESLKNANIS